MSKVHSGLYDRINRIGQLVCNVSDLERAREFWERWTPMRATAKITADGRDLPSLGITKGSFDGYILKDRYDFGDNRGFGRFELWMIEWKTPKPVGEPYKRARNAGWYRLAFKTGDPLRKYDDLVAGGVVPFARPGDVPPPPARPVSGFGFRDPDGSTIQILKGITDGPDRLSHAACPVYDLQRQSVFYQDVLGLVMIARERSVPIPNVWEPAGQPGEYEVTYLRARGDTKITLDVQQWYGESPTTGSPYQSPTNLGYAQIGFEVDDIEESYEILSAMQRENVRADFTLAGPPEVWNLGPEVGSRKVVILYDWMGIRYQLTEAPAYPAASREPLPAPTGGATKVTGEG